MLALRLWLGGKCFGPGGLVGARVSPHRMIKWNCEEPELEVLRYVAANTDIPIPRLCRVHRSHNQLALGMIFFSGCGPLQVCWRNYTCNQKQAIVDEIVAFIKQLRKLEAPCPQRTSRTAVHVATSASARSSDLDLSTILLRSMIVYEVTLR